MPRYIDPKTDIVFKKIFGEHPHLLISFLNAVLPLEPDNPIVALEYLSAEQIPDIPEFKYTIADVKCKDSHGRFFIVEMQMNWTDTFKQRLLFGSSQAFVKKLRPGEHYKLLQPVYGLGLVDAIYDHNSPDWYHHYQLVKKGSPESEGSIIKHLQLIFIELPKFPIRSLHEKKLRLLWLRFLREINERTTTVDPDLLDVPEIAEAILLSEEAAFSPKELYHYAAYWDQVSRERTLFHDKYEEGIAQGMVKGQRDMVKKMLLTGMDITLVMSISGFTEAQIADIAKDLCP
jgi:predicted transposase/invertase (TIGR01784 family)